jgi:hypothetical protein
MPYEIDYLEDEKIVTIKNRGEILFEDLLEQTKEALELARRKNATLFLSDNILLENKAKTFEIYELPKIYDELGASRNNKLAVLIRKGGHTTKDARFFETICLNRGWNVRLFTSYDDAKAWLKE